MKNSILLFMVCSAASMQAQSVFRHNDEIVQAKDSTLIDLSTECMPERINLENVPQHLIHIHDQAKKLPTTAYPITNKPSYLKCTTPQQDAQAVELLIRKETLGESMQKLICKDEQNKLSANNKVVRFYHKIESAEQAQWVPILTISEQQASSILSDMTVHPDGTLHL